jgi:hypothetical protein
MNVAAAIVDEASSLVRSIYTYVYANEAGSPVYAIVFHD